MKNNSFLEIGNRILNAETILLFPHVHVDGDALGSTSALCMALRSLGKEAFIVTADATPANLDFLENGCVTMNTAIWDDYDLALMIDCGSLNRIPGREELLSKARVKGIIDHHGMREDDIQFDFGIVEPDSAATGELIYLLLKENNWPIDLATAQALWAAIATDTGNFQHSSTTARTHTIASELHMVPGFDSKVISNLIYNRNSLNSLKLESMFIESAHLYDNGRVVVGRVTQKMLDETSTVMNETEGFVQKLTSIDGVEVACLLKEYEPELIRGSLRSKADANVASVAARFNGGGHIKAAGCTINAPIDEAEELISKALIEEIEGTC